MQRATCLRWLGSGVALVALATGWAQGAQKTAEDFHRDVAPILAKYCADCHEDGAKKGNVALDEFSSDQSLFKNQDLWWKVLKNVRVGIMPPAKEARLEEADKRKLTEWIKFGAFGIDPSAADPGRVTLRRLNRAEYRNTIHDLMGIDFDTTEEFPPDDTGYGFDTIGDALSVSPLLLEKYMQAAQVIVEKAVPRVARLPREQIVWGHDFHTADVGENGTRLDFYKEIEVLGHVKTEVAGHYVLKVELVVNGDFDFDPGRCTFAFKVGDASSWQEEFGWAEGKKIKFEVPVDWEVGDHSMSFVLHPLTPVEKKKTSVNMHIEKVRVTGPMDEKLWVAPENYERFFSKEAPPATGEERTNRARQVLSEFGLRAFRRPPDGQTLDRLTSIAMAVAARPGKSFEDGVAQAMVAMLASPRFLFRIEQPEADHAQDAFAKIDEYALASRLSYFLWSTMPDQELFDLAGKGELRKNLAAQVQRMLKDEKSAALVKNFTGQWLELRDVETVAINSRVILRQDSVTPKKDAQPVDQAAKDKARKRRGEFSLDEQLRRAVREEPERMFGRIMHEDRSVVELLNANYTYLNGRLAKLYGISGVSGDEMKLTPLPDDSVRGGLLTDSAFLMVTSNPTRTSPVKRGQFILDNILGMPSPPPPPDIPPLEAAQKQFRDHSPTFREVLELHRSKPLCASCHNRMDPLGLALENFNALGMWREADKGQPIEAAGKLMTGENFHDIRELKEILATQHRTDFYRCLTEKLLTYALGRGMEYYDVEAVDQIVDRLSREDGKFSALLNGIIESTPFQERRNHAGGAVASVR